MRNAHRVRPSWSDGLDSCRRELSLGSAPALWNSEYFWRMVVHRLSEAAKEWQAAVLAAGAPEN